MSNKKPAIDLGVVCLAVYLLPLGTDMPSARRKLLAERLVTVKARIIHQFDATAQKIINASSSALPLLILTTSQQNEPSISSHLPAWIKELFADSRAAFVDVAWLQSVSKPWKSFQLYTHLFMPVSAPVVPCHRLDATEMSQADKAVPSVQPNDVGIETEAVFCKPIFSTPTVRMANTPSDDTPGFSVASSSSSIRTAFTEDHQWVALMAPYRARLAAWQHDTAEQTARHEQMLELRRIAKQNPLKRTHEEIADITPFSPFSPQCSSSTQDTPYDATSAALSQTQQTVEPCTPFDDTVSFLERTESQSLSLAYQLSEQTPSTPSTSDTVTRNVSDEIDLSNFSPSKQSYLNRMRSKLACQPGDEPSATPVAASASLAPNSNASERMLQAFTAPSTALVRSVDAQGNDALISEFELMAQAELCNGPSRKFAALAYKKVAGFLKQLRFTISSTADVDRLAQEQGSWIGPKVKAKLYEWVQTGKIARAQSFRGANDRVAAMMLFQRVWGVGPETAAKLYSQGFRTLKSLEHADLDDRQKVGLRCFEDFEQRIPRSEVEFIQDFVLRHALSIVPGLIGCCCGSFRRGKLSSGDVDVIFTHPLWIDNCPPKTLDEPTIFLHALVRQLHEVGFLTDDLGGPSRMSLHSSATYMGVCVPAPFMDQPADQTPVPSNQTPNVHASASTRPRIHRRIDLKVYPVNSFPTAILYFTGSDHFNRSMRLWTEKVGYTLSDHGVSKAVRPDGRTLLTHGASVPLFSERDVFQFLRLDYVMPHLRNTYENFQASAPQPGQ